MKIFKHPYIFYALPQRDRKHMIDQWFQCIDSPNVMYFPIGLTLEGSYSNYNVKQGLLSVLPISNILRYKGCKIAEDIKTWFKVGAFSPDDLDLDLEFDNPTEKLRNDIISFIKQVPKRDVTYKEILTKLHNVFGGKLYI